MANKPIRDQIENVIFAMRLDEIELTGHLYGEKEGYSVVDAIMQIHQTELDRQLETRITEDSQVVRKAVLDARIKELRMIDNPKNVYIYDKGLMSVQYKIGSLKAQRNAIDYE